jgi:3-hydroxyisobutyrate dehydrogenase-like beta-hydroxyacid dehydrogenase
MPSMKQNVGILGLGIIGSRVAENLRKAGHEVFVWSRSARPVPNFLSSPREVAEAAGIIQIFVRDSAALIEAIEDMKPALKAGHLVMNHATVSKKATLEAAKLVEATGAVFLDAPFTGSKMAAQNGKLCYYIGGNDLMLERAKPVLEASAAKILPLGGIGDAMVLKIVTNLVSAVIVEAVAEAAAITKANDIPLERLHEALESNANYSTLIGMKLPTLIQGNFEPHFSLRNMLKDADFARELAAEAKLNAPALDCTAAVMRKGVEDGKGDLDFSVIGQR